MEKNQRSASPSPSPGSDPAPTGDAPEPGDEVSNLAMASGFVAILTGFYVALVALYVLGSLGIGLVLHLSSLGSGHDPWGHLLFHACLVAAIVLLVVLALGAAALLSSR